MTYSWEYLRYVGKKSGKDLVFRSILSDETYDLMYRPFVRIHLSVVAVVVVVVVTIIVIVVVTKACTYHTLNESL